MEVTRDQYFLGLNLLDSSQLFPRHVTSQTSQAPPTPLASPDAGVVFLNVGGRKFITRKETLQSRGPNFITALVEGSEEGKWKAARDEHGYIVIDRSGKIFERVLGAQYCFLSYYFSLVSLDFLRTGYLPPMSHPQRELVEVELDYFQVSLEQSDILAIVSLITIRFDAIQS